MIGELTEIKGGFHIKDLGNGKCVDVMLQLFNWRLVRSDVSHRVVDRAWCYAGLGKATLLLAVGEALCWDGRDDTEPDGWLKRVIPFADQAVELRPSAEHTFRP